MKISDIELLARSATTKSIIAREWSKMPVSIKLEPSVEAMGIAAAKWERWANIHTCVFACAAGAHTYLEIGCRRGHSLIAALATNPLLRATGVDVWSTGEYNGEENSQKLLERTLNDLNRKVEIINGDSQKVLPELIKQGLKFSFITVDGDHESGPAAFDMDNAVQLLNPSGAIIFDDINLAGYKLGEVWAAFKAKHTDWEFIEFEWGNGTGVGVSP